MDSTAASLEGPTGPASPRPGHRGGRADAGRRDATITFQEDVARAWEHTPGAPGQGVPDEISVTFADFDNLGILGSGAFADVYKVRTKGRNRRMYAIKRTRRQFRGVKDRTRAMAEVRSMERLQNALLSEAAALADRAAERG